MTTSVADVNAGTVHATAEIAAPPAAVFKVDRSQGAGGWVGQSRAVPDPRLPAGPPGGRKWSARATGGGQESQIRGEYLAVDPPRLLECTWEPSWEEFRRTIVRYTLEPIPGGTRLTVLHRGFVGEADCKDHANGWERVLTWLQGHLAGTRKAAV